MKNENKVQINNKLSSRDTVTVLIVVLLICLSLDRFFFNSIMGGIVDQTSRNTLTPTMGLGALLFVIVHQYHNFILVVLSILSILWIYMKIANKGGDIK